MLSQLETRILLLAHVSKRPTQQAHIVATSAATPQALAEGPGRSTAATPQALIGPRVCATITSRAGCLTLRTGEEPLARIHIHTKKDTQPLRGAVVSHRRSAATSHLRAAKIWSLACQRTHTRAAVVRQPAPANAAAHTRREQNTRGPSGVRRTQLSTQAT